MRLAYVCTDRGVPIFGRKGGSIHAQEVIRHLVRAGVQVEIIAARAGGDPPPGLSAVGFHELPRNTGDDVAAREEAALAANHDVQNVLRALGPFDAIYERHALWSFAAMEHARANDIPGVLEVNAPLLEEQRRYRTLINAEEAAAAVDRVYSAASLILAVSDQLASTITAAHPDAAPVSVNPNGVDPARFQPLPSPSRPCRGVVTTGFVGTLKPWHGVEHLIEAAAARPASATPGRLLVVGDGPLRSDLERLAATRGLASSVEFTGAVAPAEIPGLLASMDIAVAPYPSLPDFYFSPLKIFEYMAAGRPIVAAAIGQIDQLLIDGQTALLYPAGDLDAMTTALHRLHEDDGLRRRLGEAARRVAIREHTWEAVTRRILDTIEAYARRGGSVRPVR